MFGACRACAIPRRRAQLGPSHRGYRCESFLAHGRAYTLMCACWSIFFSSQNRCYASRIVSICRLWVVTTESRTIAVRASNKPSLRSSASTRLFQYPATAITQPFEPMLFVAVEDLVAGFPRDAEHPVRWLQAHGGTIERLLAACPCRQCCHLDQRAAQVLRDRAPPLYQAHALVMSLRTRLHDAFILYLPLTCSTLHWWVCGNATGGWRTFPT
jgi:hypothetical protein